MKASIALLALALIGCASMTPDRFAAMKTRLTPFDLCYYFNDSTKAGDTAMARQIADEIARRGGSLAQCGSGQQLARGLGTFTQSWGAAAGATLELRQSMAGPTDYEWDWDQYYDDRWQLVWACRGVQTGQFVEPSRCVGKVQLDWRWPSKRADRL